MGEAYQIKDQEAVYFLTFQVVGWADIFSRRIYRDITLDSFTYCRKNKGMELFAYVIMTNPCSCNREKQRKHVIRFNKRLKETYIKANIQGS